MRLRITLISLLFAAMVQAQGIIDVHSHLITSEFVSALESEGKLMDEGFPLPKYDVTEHLRWMDEAGIETSVLTLAAPQPTSAEVVRKTNETAARIKREHPRRFLFCAALPLPDVNAAIEEAKYALDVLKADGIKLATNVNGQYLGAPELDTLFAVLNERKAVVILHPHRPEPVNKEVMIQTPLAMQVLTQSLARMKDYLSKEPDLAPFQKMILSENARWLFGQTTNKPTADVPHADTMLYRLAEIEIHPQYLKEYLAAAAEIQKASLAEEPGVICLFPTQTKEDSCQIRILEIYASQQAYQHHIQTAHFLKYKQGTLHMVKHLKLQDLQPLTPETMNMVFKRTTK